MLALLLSFPLSLALPQEATPAAQASAQTAPTTQPDRRRVLFTAEGPIHRGRTRHAGPSNDSTSNDGTNWQVWRDHAWHTLAPSTHVTRHPLERDLLREARSLAKALPRTETNTPHTGPQLSYATWLLTNGLQAEALDTLDELLTRHPNHDSARVLLNQLPLPAELPTLRSRDAKEVQRAFRLTLSYAKNKGPAHRELAIRRLSELRDPARTLTPLLSAGRAHERTLAAHALRRLAPAKSLKPLLERCALDGSTEVRRESANALAATNEPGVILPLLRALSSNYSSVRSNSAEALGQAGFPAAVPALKAHLARITSPTKAGSQTAPPRSHIFIGKQTAYVQDFDVEVAQFAAVADPQINVLHQGAVLDVRVVAVTSSARTTRTELRAVRAALARLQPKWAEAQKPSSAGVDPPSQDN